MTDPQTPTGPLMTIQEVCDLFGRRPRTIRSWCQRRILTQVKVGGAVFFQRKAVEALAGFEQDEACKPDNGGESEV